MQLPYLTTFPGIGGAIKQREVDFFVQEIPLYEPSGEGEHVYCEVQKLGMTTFEMIDEIAAALNVSRRDIGYAGLKDARAITRQVISIWGTTEEKILMLQMPKLQVLWAAQHGNKLRLGHLKGNRFAIKIRNVEPTGVVKLRPVLDVLEKRGMPNYFGEQRFGHRGDNDILGACLVRGRPEELLARLLGTPNPAVDADDEQQARHLYDQGRLEEAMHQFPRRSGLERRVLAKLMKTGKPGIAVKSIDERLRKLWVSALQSKLFNEVVAKRIESLDKLMQGDLAMKHENGACFAVEDVATEQPRADRFEISATGPLVGYRMSHPTGEPGAMEEAIFKSHGLTTGHFKQDGRDRAPGARRAIRVKPTDTTLAAGVDEHGPHITVAFSLPPGSYATVLLRELMKTEADEDESPRMEADERE
jgi:tRNA pseudouridine13 synthase